MKVTVSEFARKSQQPLHYTEIAGIGSKFIHCALSHVLIIAQKMHQSL